MDLKSAFKRYGMSQKDIAESLISIARATTGWSLAGQEVERIFPFRFYVMSAPIDRLTEIDGIGRISAEKIREVLGEEFISD